MRLFCKKFLGLRGPALPARKSRHKRGQTLVEYALILALVAVVCIGAFALLGNQIVQIFSKITTLLDTAQTAH
jgi:Flp pilus assembly pilin Flp